MGSRVHAGIPEHLLGPHVLEAHELQWAPEGCGGDCDCAPCSWGHEEDDGDYEEAAISCAGTAPSNAGVTWRRANDGSIAVSMNASGASGGARLNSRLLDGRRGTEPGIGARPWDQDLTILPVPPDISRRPVPGRVRPGRGRSAWSAPGDRRL